MYILGMNLSHDRSTCLLKDGKILVAIAEERLDRNKKSVGYIPYTRERMPPFRALTYCLNYADISLDDIDLLVVDHAVSPVDINAIRNLIPIKDKSKIQSIPHPSHHLAHAFSAYFCSSFNDSAILIADAFGSKLLKGNEGETGFYAEGHKIELIFRSSQALDLNVPIDKRYYSLTFIYSFITIVLGFTLPHEFLPPHYWLDEAGKTMALAAYGKPVCNWPPIIECSDNGLKTAKFFDWAIKSKIGRIENGLLVPEPRPSSERIRQFHKNLAYKAQEELEKGLICYANILYAKAKSRNLCIAGGSGLNCVANRKLLEKTPFKNIFIQPAATDDGNAIGCAMYGWHKIANKKNRFYMKNAYFGRVYSNKEIKASLLKYNISKKPLPRKELIKQAARCIAEGKVVGWFQGEAEFGPRALGHRSILADPRIWNMKAVLNKKIKHREDFQPYAASVLLEFLTEYFDLSCPSPFMLLIARIKEEKLKAIPAVKHIDKTTRIQTVTRRDNGIFYDLIKEFYRITKIPLLLNTSFNVRGMPIVETPGNALEVFFYTEMDILILGNYLLDKNGKDEKEGFAKSEDLRRIYKAVRDSKIG